MKIADKLDRVNEHVSINRYDNGFMVEIGGRRNDEWATAKIMVTSISEVNDLITEYSNMPLDN